MWPYFLSLLGKLRLNPPATKLWTNAFDSTQMKGQGGKEFCDPTWTYFDRPPVWLKGWHEALRGGQ